MRRDGGLGITERGETPNSCPYKTNKKYDLKEINIQMVLNEFEPICWTEWLH